MRPEVGDVEVTAGGGCGACGTALRENARFCDQCGAAVAASRDEAKYRQVTVLFADVVRSMDIAAALDVERFRDVMTDLLERSAAVAQRYGGTVEYNGDGVMALFGAPIALEDHAFRACLTALAIQEEASGLAADVERRDGVALRLRVGLNSGRVIAGDIGSGSLGYRATGAQVGMAQRVESVTPPGAVMLSESTARLVEHVVTLGESALFAVKGSDQPISVRRLLSIGPRRTRSEAGLVGRRWETVALEEILDRTIAGRGGVVGVVGSAGIGKSRLAREAASAAASRGVEVFWTVCESHTADIPFHTVAQVLRAGTGITGLDPAAARIRVREHARDADPHDLLLLDDLLGIADSDVPLPQIDPDARRRRLTALVNAVSLTRTEPGLFVVEDVHWIDAVSEAMLTDFLPVVPHSPSMVLITYRPDYRGALMRVPGGQTIALARLADSETRALVNELLGTDPSVSDLAGVVADRSAGNPFFAEEIVRELEQRGVLCGDRGDYVCRADVAELSVPATVQATIEARIDRLPGEAKRTLNAASVIGARFDAELLATLGVDPDVGELVAAELIDEVGSGPRAEYSFHHPLIRAVAYESQLRSDRTQWHRRLAAAIRERRPGAVDENAALIAEQLHAAGELPEAYSWHMRAATWASNRDIAAARWSWTRAQSIADALPVGGEDHAALRIAPRTMLCGTAWRVHMDVADEAFDELRELCTATGDQASLAIATAGLVMDRAYHANIVEASRLASHAWDLCESAGDPALTVGLSVPLIFAKIESTEWTDVLRWSQRVIDLADGDPAKGNLLFGSPLAVAFSSRGVARWWLDRPGWHDDLRRGLAMARRADPLSLAPAVAYAYFMGVPHGVVVPDDDAVREIDEFVRLGELSLDDLALTNARMTLGLALVHRETAAERDRGLALLAAVADTFVRHRHNLAELPIVEVYVAREVVRCGGREERDDAVDRMRVSADVLLRDGRLRMWGIPATGVLVETLLDRGADGDVDEAAAAVERLAAAAADESVAVRDIWLLRLQAQVSRARGDDDAYRDLARRHRAMALSLGFEGHIAWANADGR